MKKNAREFVLDSPSIILVETTSSMDFDFEIERFEAEHSQETILSFLEWYKMIKRCFQLQDKKCEEHKQKEILIKRKRTSYHFQKIICTIRLNSCALLLQTQLFQNEIIKVLEEDTVNQKTHLKSLQLSYLASLESHQPMQILSFSSIKKGVEVGLEGEQLREIMRVKEPWVCIPAGLENIDRLWNQIKEFVDRVKDCYEESFPEQDLSRNAQLMAEIRRHMRSRLRSPYHVPLDVTVSNLHISFQDDPMQLFNLRYQSLIREFMSQSRNPSQVQIIRQIQRRKQQCQPLLSFSCQKATVSLGYIPGFDDYKRVQQCISTFTKEYSGMDLDRFDYLSTMSCNLRVQDVRLSLRDYDCQLVTLQSMGMKGDLLQWKIDQVEKYVFKQTIELGNLEICFGLNQFSAYKAIFKRLQQLWPCPVTLNTQPQLQSPSQSPLFFLRDSILLQATIVQGNPLSFALLTSQSPYDKDRMQLRLEQSYVHFKSMTLYYDCRNIILARMPCPEDQTPAFNMPRLTSTLELVWRKNHLSLQIDCHISEINDFSAITLKSLKNQLFYLHLQESFVRYFCTLKQLQRDYLRLLGLRNLPPGVKYLNYPRVIQLFLQQELVRQRSETSSGGFVLVLQRIDLKFKIDHLHLLVSDIRHSRRVDKLTGLHMTFNKLEALCKLSAAFRDDHFGWGIDACKGRIASVVGIFLKDKIVNYFSEKEIFGVQQEHCQAEMSRAEKKLLEVFKDSDGQLTRYNKLPQIHSPGLKHESDKRLIFFFSQQLELQFNKLIKQKHCIYKVGTYLQYSGLKLVISIPLKQIVTYLVSKIITPRFYQSGLSTRKKSMQMSSEEEGHVRSGKERLRHAVIRVIRGIKQEARQKLEAELRFLEFGAVIKNPQFSIVDSQHQCTAILSARKNCLFHSCTEHSVTSRKLIFNSFQLHLQHGINPQHSQWLQSSTKFIEIMAAQQASFSTVQDIKSDEHDLEVILHEVKSRLEKKDFEMLRLLTYFIIRVVSEGRVTVDDAKILMQADLHDLKRSQIIQRLLLKGHEVKLKQKPVQQSTARFQLHNAEFVLVNNFPFTRLQMSSLQYQQKQFTQNYNNLKLQVQSLVVDNLTESEGSQFRHIISFKEQSRILLLQKSWYDMKLNERQSEWIYNLLLHARLAPISVALTQPFYDLFYSFFFAQKQEQAKSDTQQFTSVEYYENIKLEMSRLVVSYKSQSKLKSLHNVGVNFEPYLRTSRLYSKKELFDSLAIHLLKEVGGQFFSIVGQKVFGST